MLVRKIFINKLKNKCRPGKIFKYYEEVISSLEKFRNHQENIFTKFFKRISTFEKYEK